MYRGMLHAILGGSQLSLGWRIRDFRAQAAELQQTQKRLKTAEKKVEELTLAIRLVSGDEMQLRVGGKGSVGTAVRRLAQAQESVEQAQQAEAGARERAEHARAQLAESTKEVVRLQSEECNGHAQNRYMRVDR